MPKYIIYRTCRQVCHRSTCKGFSYLYGCSINFACVNVSAYRDVADYTDYRCCVDANYIDMKQVFTLLSSFYNLDACMY